jgi:hypothetical protein
LNVRLSRVLALLLWVAGAAHAQSLLGMPSEPSTLPLSRHDAQSRPVGKEADASYPNRLKAILEIARRYPGRVSSAGHQYRELGLLAGIYMQTLWQHESGRDELSIWYYVNYNLTLAPWMYMQEHLKNPKEPYDQSFWVKTHPTRDAARAPIRTVDHCAAWKDYFKSCDEAEADLKSMNPLRKIRGMYNRRVTVNKKLWKAHTTSIRYSLWQYADQFAQPGIPEGELAFWRGWIKLVFLCEKISPSTTDLLLKPMLNMAMPPCSPLGTEGCSASEQPALRRAFLAWLMRGKVDQQEFLAVFGGKPSGATRMAAMIATEPGAAPRPAADSGLAALAAFKDVEVDTTPVPGNDVDPDLDAMLDGVSRRVRAAQR